MDANEILMMVRAEAKISFTKWEMLYVYNRARFRQMETTFLYQNYYDWHTRKTRASALQHTNKHTHTYCCTYTRSHTHRDTCYYFSATFECPITLMIEVCWRNSTLYIDLFVCVCLSLLWCAMVDGFLLMKTIKLCVCVCVCCSNCCLPILYYISFLYRKVAIIFPLQHFYTTRTYTKL